MYAGAAREAVFSVPAVITRIQADFVPLAFRATTVNGVDSVRDDDNERWLYQRINRAKIAPQGICVLDSRGRVLVWTQMFNDDQGVLAFLDHSLKRFREETDAGPPVVTERYLRFPGERSGDSRDPTKLPVIAVAPRGREGAASPGPPKRRRRPARWSRAWSARAERKGNPWPTP